MTDDQNNDGPRALSAAPWSDETRPEVPGIGLHRSEGLATAYLGCVA